MVTRTPAGNAKLFKEQYGLLKAAVNDYFDGVEARAIDVAVRIRTLVHDTGSSHAFLDTIHPNYKQLDTYRKPQPTGKNVFSWMPVAIQMTVGGGDSKILRDDFTKGQHELVPLGRWWTDAYLIIGKVRSSKRQVVLDVANKDGGVHVGRGCSQSAHSGDTAPFQFGVNGTFLRPDLARGTVAQAGGELLDYIERHFPTHIA
jgi:hypothetical protein